MPGPSLEPGAIIGGDFVVARLLGQGGMGAVYLAEQRSTGKLRALKVMHREVVPDETLQRRFEQEARVGGLIKSGHIVEVIAAGVDQGLPYLVMELLEGVDLRRHLRQRGLLGAHDVRAIFEQLCHGISAAHAVDIVHRDLKPENIFLARSHRAGSSESVVKVLDFGIAKVAAEAGTRATSAIGSPLWMAPEQTAPGPVTPAVDVWALGLIAYELFTGKHFWRAAYDPAATSMQLLREIVLDPIPLATERAPAGLPPGFDTWFKRCLARAPAERFQNATQLWRAMQDFLPAPASTPASSGRVIGAGTDPLAATAAASPFESKPAASTTDTPIGLSTGRIPSDLPPAAPAPAPPALRPPRGIYVAVAGVGLAGVVVGAWLAKEPSPTVVTTTPPPTVTVMPPPIVTARPAIVGTTPPVAPSKTPDEAREAHEAKPKAPSLPVGGGFENPHDSARVDDVGGPVQLTVQGRHARLLTRIVKNDSNVLDSVVHSAIDYSSWHYLRCYEGAFHSMKELDAGKVTVAFDIENQLPMRAKLEASTFANPAMSTCVVRTLSGQTINAAGASGAGHVAYAFWFVLSD